MSRFADAEEDETVAIVMDAAAVVASSSAAVEVETTGAGAEEAAPTGPTWALLAGGKIGGQEMPDLGASAVGTKPKTENAIILPSNSGEEANLATPPHPHRVGKRGLSGRGWWQALWSWTRMRWMCWWWTRGRL